MMCTQADQTLFGGILHDSDHVLHRLLSPILTFLQSASPMPKASDTLASFLSKVAFESNMF